MIKKINSNIIISLIITLAYINSIAKAQDNFAPPLPLANNNNNQSNTIKTPDPATPTTTHAKENNLDLTNSIDISSEYEIDPFSEQINTKLNNKPNIKNTNNSAYIKKLLKFNYNTQVLSNKIYKHNYNNENQHLPKRISYSNYDNLAFQAVNDNNIKAIRALVSVIKNIDIINDVNNTLLAEAAVKGNDKITKILLHHGANPNHINLNSQSVLQLAVIAENPKIVRLLLNYKNLNIKHQDKIGNTALDIAKMLRNQEIITLLKAKM